MNYLKKTAICIAAIIAAANSLGYMPYNPVDLPAFTAEAADIVASGECGASGDNVVWQLDSEGTLSISGEGEMKRFSYSSPAPWKSENFKNLIVENGVTSIVKEAFADCSSLTSVTIADSVTTIGEAAFKNCSSLTSVNIPKNVTTIDNETFKGCSSLASITIPDGVTAIKSLAFEGCSELTAIIISDSVTSIESAAFRECSKLKDVTIPESVTNIGGAVFAGTPWLEAKKSENPFVIVNNTLIDGTACKGDITIPDNVVCIADYSFQANSELKSVIILDSITKIGNSIFSYCSNLTSVTIPNSITTIPGAMFENCQKLNTITLPESIKTIETNAFFNCSELNSITIENSECVIEDSEKTICNTYDISTKEAVFTGTIYGYPNSTAQAYAEKYNRTFAALEEKPAASGTFGDNLSWNIDGDTLTISGEGAMPDHWWRAEQTPWYTQNTFSKVVIEEGVTDIGNFAFAECKNLSSVTIPASVTEIGGGAFEACESLSEINLPDGIDSINNSLFKGCSSLKSVVLPDSVKTIGYSAFENCTSLEDITIPESVNNFAGSAFNNSLWLQKQAEKNPLVVVNNILISGKTCEGKVVIPDTVTSINEEAFSENTDMTEIVIPDNVKSIGEHAFYSCGSLETITLPETDIKIGDFVFNGCDKLISVSLPESITALPTGMFGNCHNLETVIIPDTVTEIGEVCFNNCHKLKEIIIPDSVTNICSSAFENCINLTSITIENPECEIYDSETAISDTATIHGYPNSTAQAYAEKYNRTFVALDEKPAVEIVDSGECGEDGYVLTWKLDNTGTLIISGTGEMDSWALNSPWSEHSDEIKKVIIENGVTTIGEQAFSGCKKLAEITIPDSVTNIKTGAFFDCTGLTSIKIPESVTEMGHSVFYGCVNLKEVTIPSGVETINTGVFRDCQNLETITFSKNVKKVDFTALCGCSNLKSVIFEHPGCKIADAEHTICNSHDFDTEENVFNGTIYGYPNSTAQEYAEKYNRKFVALEGKPAIEVIDSGECGVMEEYEVLWMFDSEGTLTISGAWGSMYFPDGIAPWNKYQKDIVKVVVEKRVTGIEVGAFAYCTNLKSVTISDDVMYIGPYAFSGCTSLESIVIPDSVTDIEYSTFKDCKNLTSITLPESIVEIGHSAFEGCEKLASITLENPECVIDDVENTIPDTTVIYGCENSNVQAYAEKYNITFVALGEKPAAAELGDVNEDGKVDSSDASLVLEEYAAIQTGGAGAFTENQKKAADVNNDGKTDSSDASKILEYYAMISTGKEPSWD